MGTVQRELYKKISICFPKPLSTVHILCTSSQSVAQSTGMLFDTTTTQEQHNLHARNNEIVSLLNIIVFGVPTSADNVAASLSFGAYNETETGQVAGLPAELISLKLLLN